MYTQSPYPSTASPYTSPPPPPSDPYRASPISVSARQPYAFSPPPQSMPMPPMPPGANPGAYMRSPPPGAAYGYPQQQAPRSRYPAAGYPNGQANGGGAAPMQGQPQPKHKGTLAPGQIVKVGEQAVRIEKYLSEGGYAHVYLTTSEQPIYPPQKKGSETKGRWGEKGYTQHCLKRIAFQDESVWADVRKEIEVMKALPPNPHLTQYLGSAHTKLPRGGYEVYILMEFCSGGGIIDLLNKRLRDRLKEIEILNIFTDVCEAVAAMHFLRQPLLHRDLKIENVLSSPNGQPPTSQRPTPLTFKLCDFGSTTFPATQPPSTKLEAEALALDLNKHTTLQYRSPEMVEPMLGLAVGLPSDVWALGVLLYKLCYYTTPFEEHGTLAIVNAKYTFPQYPLYSPKLQHLIASMLVEQPVRRPSVFEVLKVAHEMSGTRPEIDYPTPSRSFASPPPAQQSRPTTKSSSTNLLDFTSPASSMDRSPVMQPNLASTVQPQRRGRPTSHRAGSSHQGQSPQVQPQIQPPMPVPPTITHQQPTPSSGSGPKLQVTGDKASPPKSTGSVDAFGMPSLLASGGTKPRSGSTASGFGDSFASSATPKPQAKAQFTDSFSGRQGSSLSVSPSQSNVRQASPSTQTSFSAFDMPRTTSPAAVTTAGKSPDPASSIPDGEVSFETRFPSIETMDSNDAYSLPTLSTIKSPSDKAQENLISPITSPPALNGRKPSLMGNMTGGDMANKNSHLPAAGPGGPQPRSTHVTGTAFKQAQGGMLSPDPGPNTISTSSLNSNFGADASKRDYFDGVEARPLVSRAGSSVSALSPGGLALPIPSGVLPDLMTGDDTTLGGALLRPTSSRTASDIGHMPRPPSATSSIGTAANIPSGQPPAAAGTSKPRSWRQDTAQSSSDEEGPENATRRKPSREEGSGIAKRMSMFERRPEGSASGYRSISPVKSGKPSGLSPTKSSHPGQYGSASATSVSASRSESNGRGRPVSMYGMPPSASSRSTFSASSTVRLSPPPSAGMASTTSLTSDASHTPTSTALPVPADRPRHTRKGSINDIVSKYESLTSPVSGSYAPKPSKPSVAAKPAGLRKPTNEVPPQAGTGPTSPTATSPVKASREKPAKPSKPELIRPIAVRHGETPPTAQWSKASSGRSFPVVPNKPNLTSSMSGLNVADKVGQVDDAPGRREPPGAAPASGKSSPEKQQPVNMLIQRWNQGKVGEERKAPRKGEGFI